MSPSSLVGLILLNLVGVASPGPDIVLILRTATRSRRHAVAVTLGIQIGVLFWCTITVLGAAALLTAFPEILGFVQIIGGGWLLWMGYGMLRGGLAARRYPPADLEELSGSLGSPAQSFRQGLITNLSNPKIVLFLAALIAPLLPPSPSVGTAIVAILALAWSSLALQMAIALVVSTKTVQRRLLRATPYIDILAGLFFLVAGVVLIFTGLRDVVG